MKNYVKFYIKDFFKDVLEEIEKECIEWNVEPISISMTTVDCVRVAVVFQKRGKRMTNYERIQNMTIEEMTEFINEEMAEGGVCNCCDYDNDDEKCPNNASCKNAIRRFLELESESEAEE